MIFFSFSFKWLSQKPAGKMDSMRNNIFIFFLWGFFFLFVYVLPSYHPWRGHRMMKGLFCITCRVALRPWICPINHAFNTGRDSVDSPSGCKVKTLMYSTFANELQKSFFLFQFSFNRFTTVVCLYNVTFLYFYVWEKYTGAKTVWISTGKYMRYIM